jgi:hypothetical protein
MIIDSRSLNTKVDSFISKVGCKYKRIYLPFFGIFIN